MATGSDDQNDNHQQGCCNVWFTNIVSLCSFGSSEGKNDDGDHDHNHVITDRIEEIRRPLIPNQSTVEKFWRMTAIDRIESEETKHEHVDVDDHDQIQFHQSENERAFRLAARLSRLMADFLFLIRDEERVIIQVFGRFKATLEPKSRERQNLVVVNRVLALLETGEEELRKRTNSKRRKNFDRNEHFFDRLIDRFCEQVLKLEAFMTSKSVSELLMLTEAVLDNMVGILDQCTVELDSIEQEIAREYEKVSRTESYDDCDQILRKEMVLTVEELWSGIKSIQI